MPKHQCQSTNAHANAKAQWPAACGAAAPLESSSSPALLAALLELSLAVLLLSVGDAVEETGAEAVEETGAEAVEETDADAVLLLLLESAGRHSPSTKCLRAHCVLSSSSCVGMVLCEPRHPIAPPQQSVLHMSGTMRSYNACFLSEHSVGNTLGSAIC